MVKARRAKKKIRVMVADREAIFRFGLKKLFALEDDLRVVAEAENVAQLLANAETFRPDVIFLQEEIFTEGGGEVISKVQKVAPHCKVVAIASASLDESSKRHVRSGAAGVILKTVDAQFFVKCARRVSAGETWFPKKPVSSMGSLLEADTRDLTRPVDTLTHREKTVISYLMLGWHSREIGNHLSISEQTVKNHLRNIYDKTGVSDRLELVLYAIHQRMELPPVTTTIPPS